MSERPGVSIIIVNYNYGRFLGAAIDSALQQDYPLCEVIVVDDCSTDDSRAVIARYGDRIRSVLQDTNRGQIAALNSAWPLARHPLLIFLDSDDLLFPHAAATVAEMWKAAIVKAQFLLAIIDKTGRQLGHVTKFPPNLDTETIRAAILRTGGSPNSPSSGNVYSRSLLERITGDGGFEIEHPRDISMDTILECNAPFYGEVVTIYEPLACYRIHDRNDSLQDTINRARFDKMSLYFTRKLDYLACRLQTWNIPFDPAATRDRSPWALECRLAAAKLTAPGDPLDEPISGTLARALRACTHDVQPLSLRIIHAAWFVSVAVAPRPLARRLIALRFKVTQRPVWFERLFTKLFQVKAPAWRGKPRTDAFTS